MSTITTEPPDGPEWLSLTAAADHLGCSRRTVLRLIDTGQLTRYRLGSTTTIRVRREDVDALLTPDPINPTAAGGGLA